MKRKFSSFEEARQVFYEGDQAAKDAALAYMKKNMKGETLISDDEMIHLLECKVLSLELELAELKGLDQAPILERLEEERRSFKYKPVATHPKLDALKKP